MIPFYIYHILFVYDISYVYSCVLYVNLYVGNNILPII